MSSAGYSLKQCNGFLPTPFTKHFPIFAVAAGLTVLCSWLNNRNFSPVESMGPDFKSKENIIARTDAPAVFINPIRSGLPGTILGPDDIPSRG